MEFAGASDAFELFFDVLLLFGEVSLHELGVGFTLSTAHADATNLLHHLHAHAEDAWTHVVDGGEFDLQLGFDGLGVFLKDFKDEIDTIPGLDLVWTQLFAEFVHLSWLEKIVHDNEGGFFLFGEGDELVDFSRADVGAVVREVAFLYELHDDDAAEGVGERFQFEEASCGDFWICLWWNDVDQDGARFERGHDFKYRLVENVCKVVLSIALVYNEGIYMERGAPSLPELRFETGEIDIPPSDGVSGERPVQPVSGRKHRPEDVPVEKVWATRLGVGGDAVADQVAQKFAAPKRNPTPVSPARRQELERQAENEALKQKAAAAFAKAQEAKEQAAREQAERTRAKEEADRETEERRAAIRQILGSERAARWALDNERMAKEAGAVDDYFCEALPSEGNQATQAIQRAHSLASHARFDASIPVQRHRRSEAILFDDQGVPWRLRPDGRYGDKASPKEADVHLGLAYLHETPLRDELELFFRERFGVSPETAEAMYERVASSKQAKAKRELSPQELAEIHEGVMRVFKDSEQAAVDLYLLKESDDHFGIEACSREKRQWLQNRLLGLLSSFDVLKHTPFQTGVLESVDHGADLSFTEEPSADASSPAEVATAFARLGMTPPREWATIFPEAGDAEAVQENVAELAIVSVLTNDVGGGVSAYGVDKKKGAISQRNTGQVFSAGAEFFSQLSENAKARAQEKKTHVRSGRSRHDQLQQDLAFCSVPFEIASMHALPVPLRIRAGLRHLAMELTSVDSPVRNMVYDVFAEAFPHKLIADREFRLFCERVASCARQKSFAPAKDAPTAVETFRRNLRGIVQDGGLLTYMRSPDVFIKPAAQAA